MLLVPFTASALAPGDVISARRDGLKAVGHQMDRIEALINQRGDTRAAVDSIAETIRFFEGLPSLFPPNSGQGDTRARPTIWSDPGGFAAANANMLSSLRSLENAANTGDKASFQAAFQQTAATCSACHRPFRGRGR
ncbi:MAG: cytochrome c [Roseomonas sp.]|nr:cytochrome c [Roseomonas sp.]MCA3306331.1 cytochrome c [Roseomonas sp.]